MTRMTTPAYREPPQTALLLSLVLAGSLLAVACDPEEGEKDAEWAHATVGAYERGKALGAKGDMVSLSTYIMSYVTDNGSLPEAEDMAELAQLLEDEGYSKRVKVKDPWGNEYFYWTDGSTWSVSSIGKDGEEDTGDDMEMEDGAMIKIPEGMKNL